MRTAENFEQERQDKFKIWQQKLERSHYETERAYRQYNAVEPENRLVVRTLEKKWEETLSSETLLKQKYEQFLIEPPIRLSEDERNEIYSLACDIPLLWKAKTTTQVQRKEIVRLLIEYVKVKVLGNTEKVHVDIHWIGGYQTEADFNRPEYFPILE